MSKHQDIGLVTPKEVAKAIQLDKYGFLGTFIGWLLMKILKISTINKFYKRNKHYQGQEFLDRIKQNTSISSAPINVEDFDFGEELGTNVSILKDVRNTENGYYLVIAVHSDVAKRDDFLRKTVALGQFDIIFFFDVTTSKYYIYYDKFDGIEDARNAIQSKESKPYNSKMSLVKIEN